MMNRLRAESLTPIEGSGWGVEQAAHLLERAGFGGTPAQIALGYFDFTNQSTFDKTWTDWTPRLVVDYQLTDAAMVYLSAAKGFKGGTTSGRDVAALRNFSRIVGDPEIN